MAVFRFHRSLLKALFAVGLALTVAACAKTPAATVAGAATPGSPQDFSQNVGDRVLFTVDSSRAVGKERPVSVCDAEACWSHNRRAGTVLAGT